MQVLSPMLDGPAPALLERAQYCEFLLLTPFKDLQKPAEARQIAQELVEKTKGKDAYTLDLLAQADYATGNTVHALETEKKALDLLPPNGISDLKTRLEAKYCEMLLPTEPARALQYAKQLVDRNKGTDAYTLDLLAQADYLTGNAAHAVETEKKALALFPSNNVSEQKKQLEANLKKFSSPKRKQAK